MQSIRALIDVMMWGEVLDLHAQRQHSPAEEKLIPAHLYELRLNKLLGSRENVQQAASVFGVDAQAEGKGLWDVGATSYTLIQTLYRHY